jgi:protocatechuate 3,4-dioxygenase beta subunit
MKLVPDFLPSTTGLKYSNDNWPSVPDKIIHTPFGDISLGNASNGLCGGMVFASRDVFEAGKVAPPFTENPAAGSPAFNFVVDRLFDSMNIPDGVLKWYDWMRRSRHDIHPIGTVPGLSSLTINDEMPKVRRTIDQGHPCPIGLLLPEGHSDNPFDMGKNHVVMVYGYEDAGNTTTIRIYDPNCPMDDGVIITFDNSHPDHTTDFVHNRRSAPAYGFFALDWYSAHDPSPLASDGNPIDTSVDGILLRQQNGAIWVVFAGAKFHVPDPSTLVRLFRNAWIFAAGDDVVARLAAAPVDGTLLREENGSIWVIYGKAKFHVPDPATLARLFPNSRFDLLWNGALDPIGLVPVDGTLLKEESSPQVWVIANGRRKVLAAGAPGPVRVLWNAALAQIPLEQGTIEGKVTDAAGAAKAGGTVMVGAVQLSTDANGHYSLKVDQGSYTVSTTLSGFVPAKATVNVPAGGDVVQNFALAATKPFTLTGKVTDSKAVPIAGAAITLYENSAIPGILHTTTDAAGSYRFTMDPGPYAGSYSVAVIAPGCVMQSATIPSIPNGAAITQNFTLVRLALVLGQVTDGAAGTPVPGATVQAGDGAAAKTDATGRYNLTIGDPGNVTLTVNAFGYVTSVQQVAVADGATVARNVALAKAATGSISGTVTDCDTGDAMVNVTVAVLGTPLFVRTAVGGRYTLAQVPAGSVRVRASAPKYLAGAASVTVAAGKTANLDFRMDSLQEIVHAKGPIKIGTVA